MNRRGFLKMLGLAGPAAIVALKYFFAPVGGWHSDAIVNPVTIPGRIDLLDFSRWYTVPFEWTELERSLQMNVTMHSVSCEWIALA